MADVNILAIESSCDETACAVVANGNKILSNVVASQIDVHTQYGGVVPEVASRIHVENISIVIAQGLAQSGLTMADIDAVAFTRGPGLIGSLHVGVMGAKTLAWLYDKPLVPVQHLSGHIYANAFVGQLQFPLLALVISGGHTELVLMKKDYDFEVIGTTQDDAIGEAYDKIARILGLGYPGGPVIDKMAKQGHPVYTLPHTHTDNPLNFSFSGLKSAVQQAISRLQKQGETVNTADMCASFQETALADLWKRVEAALDKYEIRQVVLAGGVAANSRLRVLAAAKMSHHPDISLIIPPLACCTDNAAMIGASGYQAYQLGIRCGIDAGADAGLEL